MNGESNAAWLILVLLIALVLIEVATWLTRRAERKRKAWEAWGAGLASVYAAAQEGLYGRESKSPGGLDYLVGLKRSGEVGGINASAAEFWRADYDPPLSQFQSFEEWIDYGIIMNGFDALSPWTPGLRYRAGEVVAIDESIIEERIRAARSSVANQVESGGVEVTVRGHAWLSKDKDKRWLATQIGDVEYRHTFEGQPIEWVFPGIGAGQERHYRGHTIHFTNPGKVREFHVDPPADPKYPGFKPFWWLDVTREQLLEAGIAVDEVNMAKDGAPPIMATKVSYHPHGHEMPKTRSQANIWEQYQGVDCFGGYWSINGHFTRDKAAADRLYECALRGELPRPAVTE